MSRSEQIVAAIIGGLFAVAAAVIGVALTQHNASAHSLLPEGAPIAHPTNTDGATLPPSPASSAASEPTASGVSDASIVFRGPVEFSGNDGIDFDVNPPTSNANDTVSLDTAPPAIETGSPNYVAVWPNRGIPTQAACREWVETHPLGSAPVQVGTKVCIRSVGLRTIYLKVTGLNVEAGTISASVIVWSN